MMLGEAKAAKGHVSTPCPLKCSLGGLPNLLAVDGFACRLIALLIKSHNVWFKYLYLLKIDEGHKREN